MRSIETQPHSTRMSSRPRRRTRPDGARPALTGVVRSAASRGEAALSSREAAFRFLGVTLLVLIAYLHLMDISHKVQEGVWYMTFLFLALILGSLALAVALVRTNSSSVRFVWVGAAAIAFGAIFGFCTSRAIPLPGMADHHGDWFNTLGVFAAMLEFGLIGLAGYSLRDRVRRLQGQRRARRGSRLAAPALGMFGLMLLQPTLAFAHGGEEMTEEEMMEAEMGHDMSAMSQEAVGHEPLLGSFELAIALFLAVAFIGWAGYALRARIEDLRPRPRRALATSSNLQR